MWWLFCLLNEVIFYFYGFGKFLKERYVFWFYFLFLKKNVLCEFKILFIGNVMFLSYVII